MCPHRRSKQTTNHPTDLSGDRPIHPFFHPSTHPVIVMVRINQIRLLNSLPNDKILDLSKLSVCRRRNKCN